MVESERPHVDAVEADDRASDALLSGRLHAPYSGFNGAAGWYSRIAKPVLDRVVALPLTILFSPVLVVVAAVVAAEGSPVFYRGVRSGLHGKPFHIFKFRTMRTDAEQTGGGTTALDDPRITRVGAFLRDTKLDELPQLFNVLRGEMSLVGPRPELLQYTQQYRGAYERIHLVKPGITDLSSLKFIDLEAQVGAEDPDTIYETVILGQKNDLRLEYADTVSFALDTRIVLSTASATLMKALRRVLRRAGSNG